MTKTLEITTEQINDLPLLLGLVEDMGIRQQIDAQIRPHGHWQGISVGTVVSIWLCHLLMERDHRLAVVRDWAAARTHTLNDLLGIQVRDTDLTDDRLANVLTMLSGTDDQAAVDQSLLADWLRVYALPQQTVRLDSTSVSVYQDARPPDGLLRHGVSKEHRPDLAQLKVMLASLDPVGLPLACQTVPGNRSDDLLYIPAYDAAMQTLGTTAVLVVGDSKMAALGTRAHIVRADSAYLCPYRPSMATAQIAGWITQALERAPQWQAVREGRFDLVVGSRSALFAPVASLGLIVLDEEHEWTYKQHDPQPRYHARAVAERLAALTGARVVLGSATPDVVSYHLPANESIMLCNAILKEPFPPISLPKREYMEHAREIWEELDLPLLKPRAPWYGYSLGQWDDELDHEAELAVQGRHFETGEKLAGRREKA